MLLVTQSASEKQLIGENLPEKTSPNPRMIATFIPIIQGNRRDRLPNICVLVIVKIIFGTTHG